EEPLELFSFEDKIPQQNLIRDKVCKMEVEDEDEMAPSHFDVSAFGPPISHFPIPSFPLEPKEEIIKAEDNIDEDGKNG
ncbi:hypothetical protein PENTCL1PPCAC_13211, partial [Pristionchus entomophagus]